MPKASVNPRDSYEHYEIVAVLHRLHNAYRETFGALASPDYTVQGLSAWRDPKEYQSDSFGKLLPSWDGWCYSPEWPCPIRREPSRLPHMRPSSPKLDFLNSIRKLPAPERLLKPLEPPSGQPSLLDVENRIVARATTHLMSTYAEAILEHGIQQAKLDVLDTTSVTPDKIVVRKMRLQWLEKWKAVDRHYLAFLRRGSRVNINRENIMGLIRREDMIDAFDAISEPLEFNLIALRRYNEWVEKEAARKVEAAHEKEEDNEEEEDIEPVDLSGLDPMENMILWYQTVLWHLGETIDPTVDWRGHVKRRLRSSH